MTKTACLALFVLLTSPSHAQGPVKTKVDPKADFTAIRTYAWRTGHKAYNPKAHDAIVKAIDAELAALGLKQVDDPTPDVTIRYHTVLELDVDIEVLEKRAKEGKTGVAPRKKLGMLAVVMAKPAGDMIWGAQTREHVDEASLEQTIRQVVSRLFESYPGREAAKR